MQLNGVQFDMLCLENKLMHLGNRTWIRHSRPKELKLLYKDFKRRIGTSWLDDNRGALKRNGYHRAWQSARHDKRGRLNGTESRRQFTIKAVLALNSRGVRVSHQIWHALKKPIMPPPPGGPQLAAPSNEDSQPPKKPHKTPFHDP